MPVGQLDGHIVHAMFGNELVEAIGQIAPILFVQPGFLVWAFIPFFMPIADEPALNDVSELDTDVTLGLLALGLLVMIILPAPNSITQLLQISIRTGDRERQEHWETGEIGKYWEIG